VDRMVAGQEPEQVDTSALGTGGRKVRAPQGTVMGNPHRPQGQGKCSRKQTASPDSSGAVRVKR
jgi:hypothetical protein